MTAARDRSTRMRALAALAAVSLLAACGQKGPLFLPATQGTAAKPARHAPSTPEEDRAPAGPLLPPVSSDEPTAPTGVVPPK